MTFRVLTLVLIIQLVLHRGVAAQVNKSPVLFYHISEKDGLSDNLVNCFYQDYRGVMWMGTQYGLNSFDGSVVSTWQAKDGHDNQHLFSNHINAIAGNGSDSLWLATDAGLSMLDLQSKKIESWQNKGDNYMRGLVITRDTIWIGTSSCLLAFNIRQKTFTSFVNQADKKLAYLPRFDNDYNALMLDHKMRLWLATVNGLWMFDRGKKSFEQYDGAGNDPFFDGLVNTIFEDHAGRVWAGTWGKGLKRVDVEHRKVISYNMFDAMPAHIMSIAEQRTPSGYKLWLSGFLTEFDVQANRITATELKPVAEAAALEPRSLFVSRDNLLWISTVKGVYIIDPQRQLFNHTFITTQSTITNQSVGLYDDGKLLWIGGDKDFVLKAYNDDLRQVKNYAPAIRRLGGAFAAPTLAIMSITANGDDLWLSTTAGIIKLNAKTAKAGIVCKRVSADTKYHSNFVNNIYIDKTHIWAFPWRSGAWSYDAATKKFNPLVVTLPDGATPKGLNLSGAITDNAGNMWLSDLDFGVVKYVPSSKKFTRFVSKDIPPYSRIVAIKKISGLLWLVNFNAVVAIDPKTNRTQSWRLPPGMDKYTYDYTDDSHQNIWIAAKTGLIVFNTVTHSFNQYTEDDGLINNNMDGQLHLMSSGKMIYAGENYVTSFNPSDLLRVPGKKALLLSSVSADDADLPIGNRQAITVPPGSSKVSFKWSLINYTNPLQNRYYARLAGIDNGWNDAGNKGHIEYNNLPPGSYRFTYKAVTADGLAHAEQTLVFKVMPTFWQTWLFKFLLLVLVILIVVFIIRYVRIKEQRKAALQVQLSELEMKALRAQMNPHFIFNALNSIQECIITKKTDAAYTYLSSFSKLVRLILENSEKQFITLSDEMETLRLYLSVEKLRFDDTFDYQIDIAPTLDPSFVRIPSMIIQPFVENALWHGLIYKKGSKLVKICFKQENSNLVCTVEDNGIGRNQAELLKPDNNVAKQSLGLKITAERLQLLKAETVILIDDLINDDGEAAGTKVTFVIPLKY